MVLGPGVGDRQPAERAHRVQVRAWAVPRVDGRIDHIGRHIDVTDP